MTKLAHGVATLIDQIQCILDNINRIQHILQGALTRICLSTSAGDPFAWVALK